MIKLFVTDLDGCLSDPFTTPDWQLLSEIRALNEQSANDPLIPPLTICSGRPASYVEAVAQCLNIKLPVVFESAGILHPQNNEVIINNVFNEAAKKDIKEIQKWLQKEIIPREEEMSPEF